MADMSPNSSPPKPESLRIAVVGGGIGGLALAVSLLEYAHTDVQIYESAHSFGEIGAGISFAPNSQKAIRMLGANINEAFLKHAISVSDYRPGPVDSMTHRVGAGQYEGEIICTLHAPGGMRYLHRAHFLDELVKLVPTERCHFGKRLERCIDDTNNGGRVELRFKDGSIAVADAVIGADGLHSVVRQNILGPDHPAARPVYGGYSVYRILVPMNSVAEALGEDYAYSTNFNWGHGKAVFGYPIDGGVYNIAIVKFQEHWDHGDRVKSTTAEERAGLLQGWGHLRQGFAKLIDSPNLSCWGMFHYLHALTYHKGHIVVMGDAAHAMVPTEGQGAGQALEDALVLKTLLGRVRNKQQLHNAFMAYDQVRRPRSQRLVNTTWELGQLIGMQNQDIANDLSKMKEATETRFNWIWNRNLDGQNAYALELFEESL